MERIDEVCEIGVIDINEYQSRIEKAKVEMGKLEEELKVLQKKFKKTESMTTEDKINSKIIFI